MTDRSISDLLSTIQAAEDDDSLFIIAAAINLYSEAMRRKTGRILYTVEDVKALGAMCGVLLTHPEPLPVKPGRSAKPTEAEAGWILSSGGSGEPKEQPEPLPPGTYAVSPDGTVRH